MEDEKAVRRTRSGKIVKTPPAATKVTKANKPGPASRKTRKKVVLMEVEVSDDDETTETSQNDNGTVDLTEHSDQESNEKKLEEQLLASPESSDTSDVKEKDEKDKTEVNGNTDSDLVVINNAEMIQLIEEEKMEVDDDSITVKPKTDSEKLSKETEILEDNSKKEEKTEITSETTEKTSIKSPVSNIPAETEKKIDTPAKSENKIEKISEQATKPLEEVEEKKDQKESDNSSDTNKTTSKPSVPQNNEVSKETCKAVLKKSEKDADVEKMEVDNIEDTSEEKSKADKKPEEAKIEMTEKIKDDKTVEKSEETKSETITDNIKIKGATDKVEIKDESISDKVETKSESVMDKTEPKEETLPDKTETKETLPDKTETKETLPDKTEIKEEKLPDKVETKKESIINKTEMKEASTDQAKIKEEMETDQTEPKDENKIGEGEAKEDTAEVKDDKQKGDPDAENISEDELPGVPVVKVPEAEEVSDEELPGPKRAELPADTEVVSEDELPTVKNEGKKEGVKRKLNETDYDPGSPTSESETPSKKPSLEAPAEKDEKPKPKKLPELDKYWKAVNDDPTDFTGWTYLLQYVDQENDMEAAREAYDAFLSHYPYCYGYWRKYADYEKRKGNKKKCEEVFERGLKAIPLSVDLWIHYLTYVKTSRPDDEDYIRSQFERALTACGLEFRSDRLWDSYIKWENEGKRLQKVTAIYDRLLATPTQGYTTHFDNFQEHIASNPPNKIVEVDEFLALRKEVRHLLKHDAPSSEGAETDAPPGDEDQSKAISSDEETKSIRERIVSIRRKIHKSTVNAVTARWNYEEGIKRPYFHVKPLERCQLKNWQDYLDYETEQGDKVRIIVLFERCLIACALYEEFWLKFVHYLENLKDSELQLKIRDVYERACTIHHLKKPNLHLQWAMFEESVENANRAAEILVNLEKSVPNVLQIAYRRINLERRRGDFEKCTQLYEHYIGNFKNKMISSNISIKYSRFCLKVLKNVTKAQEVLKLAITKDPNNPRLYLQLIDLTLQKEGVTENEIIEIIDSFLEKESTDIDQKVLFAQRKLEYLEDFGSDIQSVQTAYENYQKLAKQSKDNSKKKEIKTESASTKKEKSTVQSSSQSSSYGNYGGYGPSSNQPPYPYSGSQQGQYNYSQYGQGDQYQYQNWQYPQGGYGGYNQWGSYGGGYGY